MLPLCSCSCSCNLTEICTLKLHCKHIVTKLTDVNQEFEMREPFLHPSLRRVRVAGVQTRLCGRRATALWGPRMMQSLCAPPQALQRLQERPSRPFLLQRRSPFLLHLGYLSEGHRLGFEPGVSGPPGAVPTPCHTLGYGQLLGKLLHGRCQDVCGKHGETHRLHRARSHGFGWRRLCVRLLGCRWWENLAILQFSQCKLISCCLFFLRAFLLIS